MSDAVDPELARVIQSVVILTPELVGFSGEAPTPVSTAPLPAAMPHPLPADPLVRTLQGLFYNRCYTHRLGNPETGPPAPDPGLVEKLSRGNRSRERWDPGWLVYRVYPGGQVDVLKGDRQRTVVPGEFLAGTDPSQGVRVGSLVTLWVTRESATIQPGFYYMFGEVPSDVWDDYNMIRFYLHAAPTAVPELVAHLTGELNRSQVPFRMKALTTAEHYTRADAVVLYCARRYYRMATQVLGHPSGPTAGLIDRVPLFSKPIAAGVGFAEDPRTGESFGMHRCRLTAEGIVDAWRAGDQSLPGRVTAVAARFAANGLQLARPYLNPGSLDLFDVIRR